ncbi:ABC transporter substrate-binding protein [Microcoleus sp. N3A4]|uniref:ABC transporter substrate-binding protein n=1 Tax=Microcoleus sp. N3A4 TaxID=3055379 RepID=UPI002FD66A93
MLRNPLVFDLKFWRKLSEKLKKSFTLGIAAVTLCTAILASCSKAEPPLRVGVNVWAGFETLYLARSLGYYNRTPIRLVDYPSATEEVRAYRNGEIEALALSIDECLVLAVTNPDVKIVIIMDFSNGGDVIIGKPEIQNLQALKSRAVGVESTALGAFLITRALEQKGMSAKDIKIVSLGVSEHERAFKNGTVDAVVTFGSARTNLLASGAKLLFDTSQIPGEVIDVIVVRENLINNQSKALQALVDGRFRALDYLTKHPQDAAIRIAPRTGVTPEQFLESLKGLRSPDLQENQRLLGKTDHSLLKSVKRLSQVMLDNKLLPKAVDTAPLLDDRLVKNVKL